MAGGHHIRQHECTTFICPNWLHHLSQLPFATLGTQVTVFNSGVESAPENSTSLVLSTVHSEAKFRTEVRIWRGRARLCLQTVMCPFPINLQTVKFGPVILKVWDALELGYSRADSWAISRPPGDNFLEVRLGSLPFLKITRWFSYTLSVENTSTAPGMAYAIFSRNFWLPPFRPWDNSRAYTSQENRAAPKAADQSLSCTLSLPCSQPVASADLNNTCYSREPALWCIFKTWTPLLNFLYFCAGRDSCACAMPYAYTTSLPRTLKVFIDTFS